MWHERTEITVSRLAKSSENVVEQLDESSKLQEEMIEKQNDSLKHQEEILKNEAYLKEALKTSTKDMKDVFAEMKQNTEVCLKMHLLNKLRPHKDDTQSLCKYAYGFRPINHISSLKTPRSTTTIAVDPSNVFSV